MSTLSDHECPVVLSDPRVGSNTADNFFDWMCRLVSSRSLVAGDIFIVDNAAIHVARDILPPLRALLDGAGVRMVVLPTYSPELNPCELVFAQVKSRLRRHRGNAPFRTEILKAFALVTIQNVLAYYLKCLNVER